MVPRGLRLPQALWRRPLSTATSGSASVIEATFSRAPLVVLTAPRGLVPVAPGETLVHVGGPSTQRTVFLAWLGAATCSLYLAAVKGAELATPELALLSPAWTAAFAAVSVLTVSLARATSSCCIRYAVLAADGAHLRLFPYGPLGLGVGAPVVVPVPLLAINEGFATRRKDGEALHVKVLDSKAHLIFDKPAIYGLSKAPGAGLSFDAKSGAVALLPSHSTSEAADDAAAATVSRAQTSSDEAAAATREARVAELRRYAVLVHLLSGNVVDASKVSSGAFALQSLGADLRPSGTAAVSTSRSLWKSAVDPVSGATYWAHEVTWQRQWTPPK